jgi:hypothetical protein
MTADEFAQLVARETLDVAASERRDSKLCHLLRETRMTVKEARETLSEFEKLLLQFLPLLLLLLDLWRHYR